MTNSGPEYPYLNSPLLPPTWSSFETRRHILDGEPDDPTKGGHRPGTGREGKGEFPVGWTDERIMNAVAQTVLESAETVDYGGYRQRQRIVNGVLIQAVARMEGTESREVLVRAVPLAGSGVVENVNGASRPARPISAKELRLWTFTATTR